MPLQNKLINLATIVLTIGAIATVGIFLQREFSPSSAVKTEKVTEWKDYAREGARLGTDSARVVITMFSDFTCPYCRNAANMLGEARRDHPNDVAIVYRHFPVRIHAADAARASVCAARQGKFESIYVLLFAQQDSIVAQDLLTTDGATAQIWLRLAKEAGVPNLEGFGACLRDPSATEQVRSDVSLGQRLGVRVVPTMLINDTRVDGDIRPSAFNDLLSHALRASRN